MSNQIFYQKKIATLFKKILITIGICIKYIKIGQNPYGDIGYCYKKFVNEELNACHDNFKKYFYNSVFLTTKDIREYSLNQSIITPPV